MTQHQQDLVAHLLPALCTVVASTKESGDSRFFCLRMVSDLLATFLLDADLYDPTLPLPAADSSRQQQQQQLAQGSPPAGSTAALNFALQQHVLPLVPPLLQQEDPMPLYALKVNADTTHQTMCSCKYIDVDSSLAHIVCVYGRAANKIPRLLMGSRTTYATVPCVCFQVDVSLQQQVEAQAVVQLCHRDDSESDGMDWPMKLILHYVVGCKYA